MEKASSKRKVAPKKGGKRIASKNPRKKTDSVIQREKEELSALGLSNLPIRLPMDKIRAFCEKHYVTYLGLFGSVLTDKFTRKSDVDFLVEFDKKRRPTLFSITTIEDELRRIVKRRVDLRLPGDLSKYFRDEVVTNAKRIYGR